VRVLKNNLDTEVIEGFGDEWSRFDQTSLSATDLKDIFNDYFSVFPWGNIDDNSMGFDLGCGSGRWAKLVAPRVGQLHCIDASEATLNVAKKNLQEFSNCHFHHASVDSIPLADGSADFCYSLGVLHHIPDTQSGIRACVQKLRPGAPFLLYLYFAFDNKPRWYRALWKVSDSIRFFISRSPFFIRYVLSQVIASLVYFPLARVAGLIERLGGDSDSFPLSYYRKHSFYVMRTDALDRFGTRLEQRFTRKEIEEMMRKAGLENISFSNSQPFWCACGIKQQDIPDSQKE